MELTILGVNLLLVIAVWHFMIRPTVLDHSRDRLFVLRDQLRDSFIAEGWDMNSPAYHRLRNLVNGYLRFTEEMSLFRVMWLSESVKKDKEMEQYIHAKINTLFEGSDTKQRQFIGEFRRKALTAAMDYAVFGSGLLMLITILLLPFFVCSMGLKMVRQQVGFTWGVVIQKSKRISAYLAAGMAASSAAVGRHLLTPDALESYSLRQGSGHA